MLQKCIKFSQYFGHPNWLSPSETYYLKHKIMKLRNYLSGLCSNILKRNDVHSVILKGSQVQITFRHVCFWATLRFNNVLCQIV